MFREKISGHVEEIMGAMGDYLPEVDEQSARRNYKEITQLLIAQGLTITTMESCTGGQIASLITDTEGSSAVLKGAFVTYCNEAKIQQGVPAPVIELYGVYSLETAEAMAKACRRAYGADIGIGITGSMGNVDPANQDSIPGEVFFAVDFGGEVISKHVSVPLQNTRLSYKMAAAGNVAGLLLSLLRKRECQDSGAIGEEG